MAYGQEYQLQIGCAVKNCKEKGTLVYCLYDK